jgi:diguanylate cyclase (GGDEF)-like protein
MHLSIKARLAISLAAILAPLLVFSAISSYYDSKTVNMVHEIVVDPLQEMRGSARLVELAHDVEKQVHAHLFYGDAAAPPAYREAAAGLEQAMGEFGANPHLLPEQREQLDLAREAWTALRRDYDRLVAARGDASPGARMRVLAVADARFHRFDQHLNDIYGIANRELTENIVEIGSIQRRADAYLPWVIGGGLLLVSVVALLVVRMIMTPIEKLQSAARAFQRGDLTHRITGMAPDELGALMTTMNDMAASLFEAQQRLVSLSSRDGLTGALNRGEFDRRLVSEWERVRRRGSPLALLLLDLDHFKNVNDAHGHLVGDQVLIAMAQLVEDQIRRPDHFARFGGEEFAIILPETGLAEAQQLAERLRTGIASLGTDTGMGDSVTVTTSIGIAVSTDATSPMELLTQADRNLYRAKRDGRNRVRGPDAAHADAPAPSGPAGPA